MRHAETLRKPPVARLAAMLAAAALSACATTNKEAQGLASDYASDMAWALERASALEAEVARLETENTRLTRQLAQIEQKSRQDQAAAETSSQNAAATPPQERLAVPAPPARRDTVVAAAEADRALAGAPPLAAPSPRLVQPSFASSEDTVFENEAARGDIPVSSVLFGVHLASYRNVEDARGGWRALQRQNPDELGLLEPRVDRVAIEERGVFFRLLAGGLASQDKAQALCQRLSGRGVYCNVTPFNGERLPSAEAE
jgi:hypothetical protein